MKNQSKQKKPLVLKFYSPFSALNLRCRKTVWLLCLSYWSRILTFQTKIFGSVDNVNQKQKKKKDEDNGSKEKHQSTDISNQKQKEKKDSEDEDEDD